MNDPISVQGVITELQNGNNKPEDVAAAIRKPYAVDEVKAMIEKLKDDPQLNQLPRNIQSLICTLRDASIPAAKAVGIVNGNLKGRQITEEEYNKQICPLPESDWKVCIYIMHVSIK